MRTFGTLKDLTMRIVSWNVNGLRAIVKKDFVKAIENLDPDILCLQETKASETEIEKALEGLTGYKIHSNTAEKKGYSGTAILTKISPLKVTKGIGVQEHDNEGRVLTAEFENFYLVNVYVPNSGQKLVRLEYRAQWDAAFREYLIKLKESKPVIVCGDLNVAHQPIDLKNDKSNYNKTAGYTQTEIDGFSTLLNTGFTDSFRHFHPEEEKYSYWSYRFNARAKNVGWRIDYFLISNEWIGKVKTADILSEYFGSDHCPVLLELKEN